MSQINRLILWVIAGGLILLLGWYGLWFWQNFERDYREARVDISPAAQRNPYLAAQRYLQRQGFEAQSIKGQDWAAQLPPATDTLLLRQLPRSLDDDALSDLIEWLEQGGHLIVTPPRQTDPDRLTLFDQIGVELRPIDYPPPEDLPASLEALDEQAVQQLQTDSVNLTLPGDSAPVTAVFRKGYALDDRDGWADFSAGDQYGNRVLLYRIERGQVAVVSDLGLFSNDLIGAHDNAYLLSKLVQPGGTIWLQYSIDMPGLPALLWHRFPLPVSITVILLLLMGWRLFLYSGPARQLDQQQRRNLMEHIDASAAYAWRIDKGQQLLKDNRDAIEQAWRRRHPALQRMSEQQRCDWLAEKTGMSPHAIARTLYGDAEQELDFIKATLVLQQLTSSLKKRELG